MAEKLLPPDLGRHMTATAHRLTELERRPLPDPTEQSRCRYTFTFDGLPGVDAYAPAVTPAYGARIQRAVVTAGTAPTGAAFAFSVRVDGVAVASGTLPVGDTASVASWRAVDVPAGADVDVIVTQQGSTVCAEDVSVSVHGTAPRPDYASSTRAEDPALVFAHAGVLFARVLPAVELARARTFSEIRTSLGTTASSNLSIKLKKNGTGVHTYTHTSSQSTDSEVISESFAAGDLLSVEIDSGGTDGQDLGVVLR